MKTERKKLSLSEKEEFVQTLKDRFENNKHRHKNISWDEVETKLQKSPHKLLSINEMEKTGGEPDVVVFSEVGKNEKKANEIVFYDCSPESPKGRRSLCYDREALDARKEHKPKNSAVDMANEMGIKILTEEEYRQLQKIENFDTKTSSWVKTPDSIREHGGALFCDRRYETVFLYHNGADSYYAARGFRGSIIL